MVSELHDEVLVAAKRDRQTQSRALVQRGEKAQESMFLISREFVVQCVVRHRVLSFDSTSADEKCES